MCRCGKRAGYLAAVALTGLLAAITDPSAVSGNAAEARAPSRVTAGPEEPATRRLAALEQAGYRVLAAPQLRGDALIAALIAPDGSRVRLVIHRAGGQIIGEHRIGLDGATTPLWPRR